MEFKIGSISYSDILSDLSVEVTHTYTGDIKRTFKGKVVSFPVSFRTVGLNVELIGSVAQLTQVLNLVQVPKVTLTFSDTVYYCTSGKFSCTDAKIERIKDRQEKKGKMTMTFVTIGVPTLIPVIATERVQLIAPDNV